MSRPTKGIKQGTNHVVLGKGYSYLIMTGSGKVYWFLNVKMSQVMHGKEVPRFSVEDEQRLAEQHFGDQLNEYDSFEDVYKNRIIATLTPLHEYQWKRWYFERIMTIGDACHKVSISSQ
jgi:2-polyprenyl-6-methoxyphenol hydroxylase-like FAD-dependent oxidoreductase